MLLRRSALWAALGIGIVIVIRTLGVLTPALLRASSLVVRLSAFLLLASSLALFLFFVVFHRQNPYEREEVLTPSYLAAVGTGMVIVLHLKNIFLIYGFHPHFFSSWPRQLEASIPWVAALFTLVYFSSWPETMAGTGGEDRRRYVTPALWGALIVLLVRTVVLINFILKPGVPWFSGLPRLTAAVLIPVTIIGSGLIVRFLLWIYRTGGGLK